MKLRALLSSTVVLIFLFSGSSFASTKVDPLINAMSAQPQAALSSMKAFGVRSVNGRTMTQAFIKASNVASATKLIKKLGGTVRSTIGDIVTATVPLDTVATLAADESIIYIEAAKPMRVKMNYARTPTKVDQVQDGGGSDYTGPAYNGSGVIIGVIDSGIDCTHADFTGRILSYWDQNIDGDGVAEILGSTGKEYTGSELDPDGACENSPDAVGGIGHGTHVAGIAAGADNSTSHIKGVAPEANIIAVKLAEPSIASTSYNAYVTTLSTNVADAVNYIFRKAQAQSPRMPAVINLSIGTSLGAHDGTSLFESSLDGLLIESGTTEKEGRAIVNAAGNENAEILTAGGDPDAGGIHATIDVSSGEKKFEIQTSSSADPVGELGGTWIDIWLESGSECTIGINQYEGSTIKYEMLPVSVGSSNQDSPVGDGTVRMYVNFSDSNNALNHKQHAVAKITAGSSYQLAQYNFDLIFTGTCSGNAWLYYDSVNYNIFTKAGSKYGGNYVNGDSNITMTIPATAEKVIAVGSYMDEDYWYGGGSSKQTDITNGTVNDISTFSSLGPTADGRTKPELAAPGEPIVSTRAWNITDYTRGDDTHQKLAGTSMASPHVAGMVALMLERNGCLKPAQIKSYLTAQADDDSYTGNVPNEAWGYGKLNAAKTVLAFDDESCAPNNPSENGSSGSCETTDDCPDGKICQNDVCVSAECTGSDDCPDGYSCVDNECQASSSSSSSCGADISRSSDRSSVFVALFLIIGLVSFLYGTKTYKKIRSK